LAFGQRGIPHPRKHREAKNAGELLRAQTLYDLPTKYLHGVLPYIPGESHLALSGAKGPLGHCAEMREREKERKAWQSKGVPSCPRGSEAVRYKP
jgi:hypothetical protein